MKRLLLACTLILAAAMIWPIAAQQPFGTPSPNPVVFSGGPSSSSSLTLPNNTYITAMNAAGSALVNLWRLNAANQIESGVAPVSVGSFVTSGTINAGGSVNTADASAFYWLTRALFRSPSDGLVTINNNAETLKSFIPGGVAPSISSGFCTVPTITNGPASAFLMDVGSACAASSGVIGLPTATNGWHCTVVNLTNNATTHTEQSATTTTTATFQNFVRTTGVAGNWAAGDDLSISCTGR